jgi:SAM-dependent MidA family methyltransferase
LDWLETVVTKLKRGYVLTIDYGYNAEKYYLPSRDRGTLQCYYQHRRHNNPYANLGYQDITAHVNFTALELYGELYNLHKIGFTQQGLFLMALGLGDRLNELSSGQFSISEIFKRRDALHQLIDPTGLGGYGVLIQGKNLTESESLQGFTVPDY